MSREQEKDFQKRVIALARSLGWRCMHVPFVRVLTPDGRIRWMTPVQADGDDFPDTLMLRGNRQLVVELKMPGGVLSDGQADWLAAFQLVGAEIHVWMPWEWERIVECLT